MQTCFLFLYPIKYYIDHSIGNHLRKESLQWLARILDVRYRQKGYAMHYLMFSDQMQRETPDLSLAHPLFPLEGKIIASGVTWQEMGDGKYPDSDHVLNQLPEHSRLVVGGFHQWDCVDKVAERSYRRGIDTFVDEDTTELFFCGAPAAERVPLEREKWTFEELGIPEWAREHVRNQRRGKPWFWQV